MPDKFKATWVSYSSMNDFLNCPRLYFLRNIYKNPDTNKKVILMAPALALGATVHNVIEPLAKIPPKKRFDNNLIREFEKQWINVKGEKGGFTSESEEQEYFERGVKMLKNVLQNKQHLQGPTLVMKADLPWYWLDKKNEIILCGKLDWMKYDAKTDSVDLIDFKTSKKEAVAGSLQLPIYRLITANCQNKKVNKAYYWYLNINEDLSEAFLPTIEQAHETVLAIAQNIKTARDKDFDMAKGGPAFTCPKDGCFHCEPYESIVAGDARMIGLGEYGREMYVLE